MNAKISSSNKFGFLLSVLCHGSLLALIVFGIDHQLSLTSGTVEIPDIVQAVLVEEKSVAQPVERLEDQDQKQKMIEQLRQADLDQKLQAAKQEREAEQLKLKQLKQEMEKAKLEEEASLAEIRLKQEKERKRLSQLDDARQEEQDRLQRVKLEREKEQKKLESLAEKRKLEEDNKKAALLKKAQAEKAEAQAKQVMASKMAADKARVDQQFIHSLQIWKGLFDSKWIKPQGTENLVCDLEIAVLPDGTIHKVNIVRSSGNAAYDESAVKAVWKASPLTMPSEPQVADRLREVTLGFKNV